MPDTAARVRDIMSRDVITVTPDDDMATAMARMAEAKVSRLPVVVQHHSEVVVVGVLSDRDVRLASNSPYLWGTTADIVNQLRALKVADVMSPRVISIVPTASVAEAARLMLEHRVGGLPVVLYSGGRPCLVGLVSRSDLLAYLLAREAPASPAAPEPGVEDLAARDEVGALTA